MSRESQILICPHEIGGQMQLLAETMRKRGYFATAASFNQEWFGHVNDIYVPTGEGKLPKWRVHLKKIVFFLFALNNYKVFHFFWGKSLLGFGPFIHLDLPILKFFGKKILVHFRGLDVVDIAHFDYLRSKTRGEDVKEPPMSRKDQITSLNKWMKYADHLLVSEPDLHYVVPNSILSPQAIDMKYWQPGISPLSHKDGIIRIAHAPSSRRKKGTEFIENAVEVLKDKGYQIELVLAEKMPAHKIKELYEQCDIGIDQVLYGWHGKVSLELMALEKPVICYINPKFGKYRPDLPIINGDPSNLVSVLEDLINDPAKRESIGKISKAYVYKYHDVERIVDDLFDMYGFKEKSITAQEQIKDAKTW